MPRVLVADDNPLSLRFLQEALAQLGIDADGVADGAAAVLATQHQSYDLLLLDHRMPQLSGAEVLQRLRNAGIGTPAIATSADLTPALRNALAAAGFADALEKPLTLIALQRALQPHLHLPGRSGSNKAEDAAARVAGNDLPALLDDAAALPGVGGDRSILRALRRLLIDELAALPDDVERLRQRRDEPGWRERLHRLQASSGFCGATALAAACSRQRAVTDGERALDAEGLDELLRLAAATRQALIAATP